MSDGIASETPASALDWLVVVEFDDSPAIYYGPLRSEAEARSFADAILPNGTHYFLERVVNPRRLIAESRSALEADANVPSDDAAAQQRFEALVSECEKRNVVESEAFDRARDNLARFVWENADCVIVLSRR